MAERKTHDKFIEELKIINPNVEVLGTYDGAHTKLECRCLIDGHIWSVTPTHLLHNGGCPVCAKKRVDASHKKKTHEEYVELCKIANPNIEIIGEYTGVKNDIKCKCKVCGGIFERRASKNVEGLGCPICANRLVVQGINDVATTHPDLVKYFVNKSDAYKYTYGSTKKVLFKCPYCNTEKITSVCKIAERGFSCDKCGDGVSYPNKFSRYFLEQLPVENVSYEWIPEWVKNHDVLYRYDNYFEYKSVKYILEMDGGFHYQKFYHSNLSLEETQHRDNEKDILAKQYGIKIIRIDCRISEKEYIVNNILNSELNHIFDLSYIDWDYCDRKSCKSLIVDVCEYYNKYQSTVTEMKENFHISYHTISSYLHKGTKLGICKYRPYNKQSVQVIYENMLYKFDTFNDCMENMVQFLKMGTKCGFRKALRNRENVYDNFILEYN